MWDNSQHLLVIRPLVVPGDMLLLASEDLLLDVLLVIIFNVPFEGSSDIWEIVLADQFHPVLLPNRVAFAVGFGSVAENSSFVESTVEPTDDCGCRVPNDKLFLLVDFVTDITFSSLDENDFSDLIKFFEKHCVSILLSWLKVLEELEHELSILLIIHIVVVAVIWVKVSVVVMGIFIALWDPKEPHEQLLEV